MNPPFNISSIGDNNKYKWFWNKWRYIFLDKIDKNNFKNNISGNVMNIHIEVSVLLFWKNEHLLADEKENN